MYNLKSNGVTDLARFTQLLDLRKITHDPLIGPVDGSNTVFQANFTPLNASGSTAVFVSGVTQNGYSVAFETGEFALASAPSTQPYANYTFSSLTTENLTRILMLGFDEMEQRWPRKLRLSGSDSTFVQADETFTSLYIVSTDGSTVADPYSSGVYLSTSVSQIALFMKCCQYAYLSQQQLDVAIGTMSYKEPGGLSVSNEKRVDALEKVLSRVERELNRALVVAQSEWLANTGDSAALIAPIHSKDYDANFDWHYPPRSTPYL